MSSKKRTKKCPDDFVIGRVLGEGAYAKVLLAKFKETGEMFAIKMVDKSHVKRYNKVAEMINEKKVLSMLRHPSVIQLHYTFQDPYSLYYVLELAPKGELFTLIRESEKLSPALTQFFAAELVVVLEYLHSKRLVHRDLKPENVLLSHSGHIKLTDFATSKLLPEPKDEEEAEEEPTAEGEANGAGSGSDSEDPRRKKERANSFVGTAEYVSPEVLDNQPITTAADIWALGCMIYQMLVGRPPFRGGSEYLTFQQIMSLEYTIPDEVPDDARDLIQRCLVLNPADRIAATLDGYAELKAHPFFSGIDWDNLLDTPPPPDFVMPDDPRMSIAMSAADDGGLDSDEELMLRSASTRNLLDEPDEEYISVDDSKLRSVMEPGKWQIFLNPGENIVFMGVVIKRRLFAKTRQLVLTDAPRFFYINPDNMELRGKIAFTKDLTAQLKNERVFYINTPKRQYYIRAVDHDAATWVEQIMLQAKKFRAGLTNA